MTKMPKLTKNCSKKHQQFIAFPNIAAIVGANKNDFVLPQLWFLE